MKIIPFRIKASEEEENYSEVYSFLVQGTNKDAYEVELDIDSFNDLGLTDERCTCPHYTFRDAECKHIKECKKILNDFGIDTSVKFQTADILTSNLKKANNNHRTMKEDACELSHVIEAGLRTESLPPESGDSQFHGSGKQ